MTRREKRFLAFSVVMGGVLFVPQSAYAMHIMEGYLPPAYCAAWGALCLPFLAAGVVRLRRTVQAQRKALLLLAMSGAFIFVISSLKIPSVTGSCSHMTGTGLAAILFGPAYAAVLGLIVLVFQAVLLAHGGLTTLGANTFSMAIAGPLVSWGVYALCKKARVNRKLAIFLAASLGDLFTYCVTSLQLGLSRRGRRRGSQRGALFGRFRAHAAAAGRDRGHLDRSGGDGAGKLCQARAAGDRLFEGGIAVSRNTKTVLALLAAVLVLAVVPFFLAPGAEFGGSDDAGSRMVEEIQGEAYEPWFTPVLETLLGGELPGEIESLLFCIQTGVGVGVLAYGFGYFAARKKYSAQSVE